MQSRSYDTRLQPGAFPAPSTPALLAAKLQECARGALEGIGVCELAVRPAGKDASQPPRGFRVKVLDLCCVPTSKLIHTAGSASRIFAAGKKAFTHLMCRSSESIHTRPARRGTGTIYTRLGGWLIAITCNKLSTEVPRPSPAQVIDVRQVT